MLKVEKSCEVDDLIEEVVAVSGKSYGEVEKQFFDSGIYPESTKTFVTDQFGGYDTDCDWLDEALEKVLTECGAKSIYITYPIQSVHYQQPALASEGDYACKVQSYM